jgi:hypothetical protein
MIWWLLLILMISLKKSRRLCLIFKANFEKSYDLVRWGVFSITCWQDLVLTLASGLGFVPVFSRLVYWSW